MFLLFILFHLSLGGPCSFCQDGAAVSLPDYLVQLPGFPKLPCSSIDALIPTLLPDDSLPECKLTHQISSICGCPLFIDKPCSLCGGEVEVSTGLQKVELEEFAELFRGNVPTCELYEAYLRSFHLSDAMCTSSTREAAAVKCGCMNANETRNDTTTVNGKDKYEGNDNIETGQGDTSKYSEFEEYLKKIHYFGASTEEQRNVLFIISRTSSVLSMICCIVVTYDCFLWKEKRKNLYHQIVGVMTIFDFIFSFSVALGTLPMNRHGITVFSGKVGNIVTCKIQGAMMQWGGLISLFMNCSLSTYYLQVVVYNAKQARLQNLKKWLFGIPIVIGTIISASSIPYIQTGVVGCQIAPPMPLVSSEALRELGLPYLSWPFICFMIVPGYTAIFYSTMITLYMLYRMKKVDQNSKKWVMNQHLDSKKSKTKCPMTTLTKLRREVFLQCFQYLAAVYVTWLLYLTVMLEAKVFMTSHYCLWITIYFIGAIQGLLNCLVYFRPRIVGSWRNWRKTMKEKNEKPMHDTNHSAGMTQPSSEPAGNSIQSWNQIAQIEPAVDIIAEYEGKNKSSSLEQGDNGFDEKEVPAQEGDGHIPVEKHGNSKNMMQVNREISHSDSTQSNVFSIHEVIQAFDNVSDRIDQESLGKMLDESIRMM